MNELASITLQAPEGSAWEFFVLFAVVIVAPPVVERFKIPGLIGLLIGGFVIGPNGLGALDPGSTTIPDLGQLGLLYLMFVAGVELDLRLLTRYRKSAITFGLLTFTFPMVLGTSVGFGLGWEAAAAFLLGSLLASHTLVVYPIVRRAGVGSDPMVASAVGATVLTDTLALVVLAVVSGTESGSGSGSEVALQIGVGMATLLAFSFVVLPWVAGKLFRLLGTDRPVRYAIAVAAFLAAAVVAETFEIEGIVGAFFAGLAMNRLVPNEGPLMDRIDFFGTALFVPVFLVSVGLLLEPSVMAKPETIGLAALLIAACLGGKMVAAWSLRPLMGATGPEVGVVFGLSAAQAAATLASTTVGFQLGLFSDTVVNAVLVLILVSVIIATLVTEREAPRIEHTPEGETPLGERVIVVVDDLGPAALALRVARALATRDAGVVEVLLLRRSGEPVEDRLADLDRLTGLCGRLGIDCDPTVTVTDHAGRAAIMAAEAFDASMVVAAEAPDARKHHEDWAEAVAIAVPAPVAIVRGDVDRPFGELSIVSAPLADDAAGTIAAEIAAALPPARGESIAESESKAFAGRADGDVVVAPITGWEKLRELSPAPGVCYVLVDDELLPESLPVAGTTVSV